MKSFKAKNVHQEFQGAGQAPRDHDERGVMPAFSNLKTGTKITATFLVVAVLLIAVAAVGYVSLKSVNAGMTTLYEDRLLPTQQLGRVNDAQLKIKRDLYQYILVSEDRNNLERDIADHIQSADKSIKQYEATYLVPVVIMLDLKMPRMDGMQVLRQIKADEHMRLIPVVVLTSSRESPDLEACYRLGVNAYVVKPVRFIEFVEAVKQIGVFWALINQPPPNDA